MENNKEVRKFCLSLALSLYSQGTINAIEITKIAREFEKYILSG